MKILSLKKRLLDVIKEKYPESSNSRIRKWIQMGRISVNGIFVTKIDQEIEENDEVQLVSKEKKICEEIPLLYKDRYFIVINKPCGLLSVATDLEKEKTLHAYLQKKYRKKIFVIHRLDKDTSGVMIFAFSKIAQKKLKNIFRLHNIDRRYLAVVKGVVAQNSGKWENFLYEDKQYYVHISEEGKGELAKTYFEVIHRGKDTSILECRLCTGKKNQIRVQSSYVGHPIIGDVKYGSSKHKVRRLCLHAYALGFCHPFLKKDMEFRTKDPNFLKPFLEEKSCI